MTVPFRRSLCVIFAALAPAWGLPGHVLAAPRVDAVAIQQRPEISAAQRSVLADAERGIESVPVVLSSDRILRGVVKTKAGTIASGAAVVLGIDGRPASRTTANDKGEFAFGPLEPGKYQLASRDAVAMISLVAPESADGKIPAAVELSQPAMIARGQSPASCLSNPWFVGLLIAAAIAIPLAVVLSEDDDDAS